MNVPATTMPTKAEAEAFTLRLRTSAAGLRELLVEAHDRLMWKAMEYKSWEAYVKAEIGLGRSRSYQLLEEIRVIEAVREATGGLSNALDISARGANAVKDDLPAFKDEIKAGVVAGADPKKATDDAFAARLAAKEKAKAEKAEQQAEYDRQREEHAAKMPEAVKQAQAAKKEAIEARKAKPENALSDADRIAELEESNRVLEAELAEAKAENALYADMKVQWEAGGYEKVIADKDEQIRALQTRLYGESEKMASWKRSADFWKEMAIKHGWSMDEVIDLETADGR